MGRRRDIYTHVRRLMLGFKGEFCVGWGADQSQRGMRPRASQKSDNNNEQYRVSEPEVVVVSGGAAIGMK